MAYKWSAANTGKVSFSVATNEDGNIATNGQTVAGNTTITMAGIKSDATFDQSAAVYGAFVNDICDGTFNQASGKKVVTYQAEVDE